jgi:UDP-N-acetylglucosamine 4,6-dehydratase
MTRFWITLGQGVDFVLRCLDTMAGGEIFVPKIPSMKVVDVARAVAPTANLDVVGLRPGEKLHEVMITRDDAINTIEFDNFYVILPVLQWWDGIATDGKWAGVGRPVAEGFQYSSDLNDWWLDGVTFRKLMEEPYA